jgi:hypothetical protein
MKRASSLCMICTACAIFVASPSTARAITVNIDITINNPATITATGFLELDPALLIYSNLDVLLTGTLGPFNFNNTSCDTCPLSGSSVGLIDPTFSQTTFLQDLEVDFGGGVIQAFFRGNSFVFEDANGRIDGTYALTPQSTVPEPSTVALLGLAVIAGLGFARRRTPS